MTGSLNCEQIKEFQDNGYLIVKDVFKPEECQALRDECHRLVDDFDVSQHPTSVFSTVKQVTDEYFMTSADKIRFFFEENAFDKQGGFRPGTLFEKRFALRQNFESGYKLLQYTLLCGNLCVDKHLSLNKVAHALHALNPEFMKITFDQRIQDSMRSLGLKKPAVCQSMFIFKQPRIGGEVVPHQDATFLHTTPVNVIGIWISLEDCTVDNGCLWFQPGSHKDGVVKRFVRNPSVSEFATTLKGPLVEYDMSKFVPAEVKKGAMVIIHGQVVHYSASNKSDKSRNIYTFHVVEEEDTEWSKENWLQPSSSVPFKPLYSG